MPLDAAACSIVWTYWSGTATFPIWVDPLAPAPAAGAEVDESESVGSTRRMATTESAGTACTCTVVPVCGGVDHLAVPDVDADVAGRAGRAVRTGEEEQIARLGVAERRHGGADLALLLARAGQRDAELPVDVLHEARAVESRRARAAPHVGGSFEGLRFGDDVSAADAARTRVRPATAPRPRPCSAETAEAVSTPAPPSVASNTASRSDWSARAVSSDAAVPMAPASRRSSTSPAADCDPVAVSRSAAKPVSVLPAVLVRPSSRPPAAAGPASVGCRPA